MTSTRIPVVLVPGLRDETPGHWQTLLAARWPKAQSVPALGRRNADLGARIRAIEDTVARSAEPVVVVAHSAGVIATVHWAARTQLKIAGALLVTPPTFEHELPPEYPGLATLSAAGWLPVPRKRLPFRTLVAASRNDDLGVFDKVWELATCWGAELVDLGKVGHLNPASGYGEWRDADVLIGKLASLVR